MNDNNMVNKEITNETLPANNGGAISNEALPANSSGAIFQITIQMPRQSTSIRQTMAPRHLRKYLAIHKLKT